MKQLHIYGTEEMLFEIVGKLDSDWKVKLDSGDSPIRPDKALEIVLYEVDDYKEDAPYYKFVEL